ncbi:hypothetical protein [Tenacibaculum sp. 190524A02b]|uniref:Uncharacterized protein n=1 Tax=Tenacibaculum vairaonense TaxID=3137860 RepID=A0ABP1FD79_9FLAO
MNNQKIIQSEKLFLKDKINGLCSIEEFKALDSKKLTAILIDFSEVDFVSKGVLDNIRSSKIPIILVNNDKEKMAETFGVGFESDVVIIDLLNKHSILLPCVIKDNGFNNNSNVVNDELKKYNEVKFIKEYIKQENLGKYREMVQNIQNTTEELPSGVSERFFAPINIPLNFNNGQKAENQILLEILLIASTSNQKYARVVTRGAGFNPSSGKGMADNGDQNRGFFQQTINFNIEPLDYPDLLIYETSPKNINGVKTYTSGSSFDVGVDKDGISGSFNISNSETTDINDFDITNNSSGNKANWTFQLSMTKDSTDNMFIDHWYESYIGVKEVPELAKNNLQPTTTSVWVVDERKKPFNSIVTFQFSYDVSYLHCFVTKKPFKSTKHVDPANVEGWRSFVINFSAVNA